MHLLKMSRRNLNAVVGALTVMFMGIMALWFPTAILNIKPPSDVIDSTIVMAIWQTLVIVAIPYYWAVKRLGMSMAELGVSTHKLGRSIVYGCALYAIALVVFVHCSSNQVMLNHVVYTLGSGDAYFVATLMGLLAAGTDMTTRGYILLTLTKYSNVVFAIVMQNLVWFIGHITEIHFLANCIGMFNAVSLTLLLGVLGDIIVLRIGNVMGLVLAHFLLNIVLTVYMRNFL